MNSAEWEIVSAGLSGCFLGAFMGMLGTLAVMAWRANVQRERAQRRAAAQAKAGSLAPNLREAAYDAGWAAVATPGAPTRCPFLADSMLAQWWHMGFEAAQYHAGRDGKQAP